MHPLISHSVANFGIENMVAALFQPAVDRGLFFLLLVFLKQSKKYHLCYAWAYFCHIPVYLLSALSCHDPINLSAHGSCANHPSLDSSNLC